MKYIKQYETLNNEPKVGDYVLCYYPDHVNQTYIEFIDDELREFLNNNVGVIIPEYINNVGRICPDYLTPRERTQWVYVKYENIPKDLNKINLMALSPMIILSKSFIIAHSPNKEDIEAILASNKFNL